MQRNETLGLPLSVISADGQRSMLVRNLAKRFADEAGEYLDGLKTGHNLGFDLPVTRTEVEKVLRFTPLVQSLFNKMKTGDPANNPLSVEEKGALIDYIEWSYLRNEDQDIRSGTHEPTTIASDHLRELYRSMTGTCEPTATYTLPAGGHVINQTSYSNINYGV